MYNMLFALAAVVQTASPVQPAPAPVATPAARSLNDVPNLTVNYYDVTGKTMKAIGKSLEKRKDPKTGQLNTGGTSWNVAPSFTRTTTNGVCTITKVNTEFSATAELPRLTNEASVPAEVLAEWRTFHSKIEADAATQLWFIHDRIGNLEKAMIGKDCEEAVKAGAAVLDTLKTNAAALPPASN